MASNIDSSTDVILEVNYCPDLENDSLALFQEMEMNWTGKDEIHIKILKFKNQYRY